VRKTKELLRLHHLELTQHQIARSCAIAQSTVWAYLQAAEAAGIRWPDIADWDDARIEQARRVPELEKSGIRYSSDARRLPVEKFALPRVAIPCCMCKEHCFANPFSRPAHSEMEISEIL